MAAVSAAEAPFTPRQRLLLGLLCFAQCMVVLDFSIVNVAVPSIQKALGFTAQGVQWLFTGYGLVLGGFLLLGGRLSDLYGRKRVFLTGTVIFTLASLLGGLSTTPGMLVAMRCLQGLGAALLAPSALALLMGAFEEGPARNRAFGVWGTVAAAGYSIGVVLGGILTAWMGWRWIMFVNIPLGVFVIIAAAKLMKEPELQHAKPRLDILGSLLVTSGLMVLVYALAKAPEAGWTSWATWRLMGGAAALLIAFVIVEAKTAEPLMPLRIFLLPGIAAANLVGTFLSAAAVAMNLVLTLHFQQVLHFSPFITGLAFLPHGLAASYAGPWGGRLSNKVGPKAVMVGGTAVFLLCLTALAFISTRNTYWYHILPATVLISFGLMPAFVTLTLLATSGAKPEDHGLVSGITGTTGQLGGALGLAILVAVASGSTAHAQAAGADATGSLLAGYRMALGTGAGFVAVALLIGWFGLKKRD
jgi:EmrB/QacA subfamily drug resistance transporter